MEKHGVKGRGGKRRCEEIESAEANERRKKFPPLASVIMEAMKQDALRRVCHSLEPLFRRIIREEVERCMSMAGSPMFSLRQSPARIESSEGANLCLRFSSGMPDHFFTGAKIKGEQGHPITISLRDSTTWAVVSTAPESAIKLTVVALQGDFDDEDDDNWTADRFRSFEVKERDGKPKLLSGELHVTLKEGVGCLGEIVFTDNSSWIKSRKFRLGVKVAGDDGGAAGRRIREGKSDAFGVKDHRGELYKKRYPPLLQDEVWRLNSIRKDGPYHKRLADAGIDTVEGLLHLLVRDPNRLRTILGTGMPQKMWEKIVDHAKTCVLSSKRYVYSPDSSLSNGLVFNPICELQGLLDKGQFVPLSSLPASQSLSLKPLVKQAYENWHLSREIDARFLTESLPSSPPFKSDGYSEFSIQGSGEMRMMEEEDEVQCLLSSFVVGDEGYKGMGEEEERSLERSEVGWVKLKAVVKWSILVKWKAAARRSPQLEELR